MNYSKLYDAFIASKSNRVLTGYTETHHILPKSLGGSNDKSNLIQLTAKEHFLAHRILAKIHGGKMWAALSYMTRKGVKSANSVRITSMVYELARKKDAEYRSIKYAGKNNPFYGKTFTPEQLQKLKGARPSVAGENNPRYGKKIEHIGVLISLARTYKRDTAKPIDLTVMHRINNMIMPKNKELIALNKSYKLSIAQCDIVANRDYTGNKNPNYGNGAAISGSKNPMYGKSHSEETKRKIAEKSKLTTSCPHCLKVGSISNMKRWHFDNCRERTAQITFAFAPN